MAQTTVVMTWTGAGDPPTDVQLGGSAGVLHPDSNKKSPSLLATSTASFRAAGRLSCRASRREPEPHPGRKPARGCGLSSALLQSAYPLARPAGVPAGGAN